MRAAKWFPRWAVVLGLIVLLAACGTQSTPVVLTSTPTPSPWKPVPLDSATCKSLTDNMAQVYGRDATLTPDAFFIDPMGSSGSEGTGCKATITGTEVLFTSPQAVVERMDSVLMGLGWATDPKYRVGSSMGTGQGYYKENALCLLTVTWQPSPDANCPSDKPLDECLLQPEQKIYLVELNCAQTSQ